MSGAADPGILACAEGAERAHIHHDLSRRGARATGTRACRRCNPPHIELVRALFEVASRWRNDSQRAAELRVSSKGVIDWRRTPWTRSMFEKNSTPEKTRFGKR